MIATNKLKLKEMKFCINKKTVLLCFMIVFTRETFSQLNDIEIARIHPKVQTGFANGGWKYDRYEEMESLDAHKKMLVADIKGPGIIQHIHTTRHSPKELFARGIVLEIWFDDAKEPAVMCPLADFFGDGCNGESMEFSSLFIECAPWSYNCYIPMPFKSRARVYLRNDTDKDASNYSYVEWETLPEWDNELGHFHATYARECFQLTKDSKITFFETEGTGHFFGRQFSIVTDEDHFMKFSTVMEGNNEVDIDSQERHIDYLGTEDSFTFSWGFKNSFAGLRAGMPFVSTDVETDPHTRLSIYRFHDYMPIRYNKSLRWSINWRYEVYFTKDPKWQQIVDAGGCWIDCATVFYWYANSPGGYKHDLMRPVEERQMKMLHSNK